jgi:hypothetical protein
LFDPEPECSDDEAWLLLANAASADPSPIGPDPRASAITAPTPISR